MGVGYGQFVMELLKRSAESAKWDYICDYQVYLVVPNSSLIV